MSKNVRTAKDRLSQNKALTDEQFIRQFELCILPAEFFDHAGHLRMAWIYLNKLTLDQALEQICNNLKAYAEHLGAHTKFNWTITTALIRIMDCRIQQQPNLNWCQFSQRNRDLFEDALTVLKQYYSDDLLMSEQARLQVMPPDLKAITSS